MVNFKFWQRKPKVTPPFSVTATEILGASSYSQRFESNGMQFNFRITPGRGNKIFIYYRADNNIQSDRMPRINQQALCDAIPGLTPHGSVPLGDSPAFRPVQVDIDAEEIWPSGGVDQNFVYRGTLSQQDVIDQIAATARGLWVVAPPKEKPHAPADAETKSNLSGTYESVASMNEINIGSDKWIDLADPGSKPDTDPPRRR